ncbi:TBC1 domain family member 10B [Triplophysa tibetana]|uniref:TBC1 domain family member 10B n=1 Tax=Triplophysa tibetana TaxID=1572043 RepID=A0A5A9N8J3_9TELE|nr:TBC1 domain family member 10B [Triplophysa tibetana]
MAEVSALSPSPPSMGEQTVPTPSSPQPLPSETPIPKSSLYGDRAVMGNPTIVAPSLTATNRAADPQVDVLAPTDAGINGKNTLSGQTDAQGSEPEHQMPASPEFNQSPNLYPHVIEVSHISNPAPSMNAPPEHPLSQSPNLFPNFVEVIHISNPAPSMNAPPEHPPSQSPNLFRNFVEVIHISNPAPSMDTPPERPPSPSPNLYPDVVEVIHISNPAPSMNAPTEHPPSPSPNLYPDVVEVIHISNPAPSMNAPPEHPLYPSPNLYPNVVEVIHISNPAPSMNAPPEHPLSQSPNLFPNVVEVSHISNPAPSMDAPPEHPPSPIPVSSEHLTTSNPAPFHPSQDSTADPSLESQDEPLPNQNPNIPDSFSTSRMALEPPCTPSKADPPAVLVQESYGSFVLPSHTRPAPDTLSYLESASLMSGTLESLSGLGEDGSSVGSDSEINGPIRRTDKYGFLGGTQYNEASEAEIRVAVARQREMKWLDMFKHWDKWISRRFQKVKIRCRKGIPSSLRSKAWLLLSNSQELFESNPGKFEELEKDPGDPKWLDIIEKDLHRQFPFHEMFAARGGHGQQDLYRILKAYTIYRPDEGYCQAQAPVAAVLLMHMPAEEAIQLDGEIFFSLLRRVCPMAYRHLKKFKIDPILYMTEWFMCIFSRTLPWSCVLRVWDMFFCEGVKIIFRVGLVLLKEMLGSVDKLRELQGMYETMERLRNIPPESIKEEVMVQEIISLSVTEALIERECTIQVRKWRESRGELTHQPGRRLHGTRAIFEQKHRAAAISSGGSLSFLSSHIPAPGPLRASSSLLSLAGLRKSKAPFYSQNKKGQDDVPLQTRGGGIGAVTTQSSSYSAGTTHSKPPISPPHNSGAGMRPQVPHGPSPLASTSVAMAPAPTAHVSSAQMLQPSPKVVSEYITPTIPSPTANNAPLPPCPETVKPSTSGASEEDGKKKKKSKEDKKREKDEEKLKLREKKEKEKTEKERLKKEKEKAEKEKKKEKVGKKRDKGGGGTEEKNGAAAATDQA